MNVLGSIGVTAVVLVGAYALLAGDPFTALLLSFAPLLALFAALVLLAART
jgi:hypothetical protein